MDLSKKNAAREWPSQVKPDAIVNAAALAVSAACEENPKLSKTINIDLPVELARFANEHKLRFIHFSSDMVFDVKTGNYSTSSPTNPSNMYGKHKLDPEKQVHESYEQSCVIRLPLLMGNSPYGMRFVHEALWQEWKEDRLTPLFEDECRQPASAGNVAELTVELIIKESINGFFYWAGAEKLNRWEMGRQIAEKFGVSEHLLQKSLYKKIQSNLNFLPK